MSDVLNLVRSIYEDIDSKDVKNLTKHLTPDCKFVFANAEPCIGRAAVEEFIGGFMGLIKGIKHHPQEAWKVENTIIFRTGVTYTLMNGEEKSYPAAVIWHMEEKLIREFLIYVDNSTLFS